MIAPLAAALLGGAMSTQSAVATAGRPVLPSTTFLQVADGYNGWVTDGDGHLYGEATLQDSNGTDVVIKQRLTPGVSEIVYSESNVASNDWSSQSTDFFVFMHISSLVTGP